MLPRVAALLDVAQVSEIIEVVSPDTFKRPIYAGNAIQTVQASDAKKVITVRTASFASASEGGSASVEAIPAVADALLGSLCRWHSVSFRGQSPLVAMVFTFRAKKIA
ncbi:electron transfer flavoprotein alpha subunit [Rhizobium leguminosarum]|uniref:Electron transfer flavoprotein alpha subunit n=1 Tax=Rhizobium leguminosarum TaxID=384 RepID=A0A7Z0IZI0_RHILE|nr:electron transfer flavoprotein alpha subunit [Rhizobium leguminosarum]